MADKRYHRISGVLDEEIFRLLENRAKITNQSLSAILRDALRRYFKTTTPDASQWTEALLAARGEVLQAVHVALSQLQRDYEGR